MIKSTSFRSILKFIGLTTILYTTFLMSGIFNEEIYKKTFTSIHGTVKFANPLFFLVLQNIFQCIISTIYILLTGRMLPSFTEVLFAMFRIREWRMVLLPAILQSLSIYLTNCALVRTPFILATLFKSAKMIPIMITGRFFLMKKYSKLKYFSSIIIVGTLITFILLGNKTGKNNSKNHFSLNYENVVGLYMLIGSLTIDGIISYLQEEAITQKKKEPSIHMFKAGLYSFLFFAALYSGTKGNIIKHFLYYNKFTYNGKTLGQALLISCFLSGVGQMIILEMLFNYGSLVLVTITTIRKFFTLLISNWLYKHNMTIEHWLVTGLFFIGIGINILEKYI